MRRSTFRPSICLRISATSSSRKLLITGGNPSLGLSSPYRPPGRSSPGGGSSRGVGGVAGVSLRLSGRSSPGGGSSLGGTSSALGGAGGTTPPRGGTASTSSSGTGDTGEVGALSSLLLLPLPSSHNNSKISVAIASTPPAPSHTALP